MKKILIFISLFIPILGQNLLTKNNIDLVKSNQINEIHYIKQDIYGNSFIFYNNGSVYGWGDNAYGQLGIGQDKEALTPIRLDLIWGFGFNDIKSFEMTLYGTNYALLKNGDIYVWGNNYNGQIGNNTHTVVYKPLKVNTIWGFDTTLIDKYYFIADSSYVFLTNGNIYVWGNNAVGQLGLPSSFEFTEIPTLVSGTGNNNWGFTGNDIENSVFTTDTNYFFLKDGRIFGTGNNNWGQLGNGVSGNASYGQIRLDTLWGFQSTDIKDFHTTPYLTLPEQASFISIYAFLASGDIYVWGFNGNGNLGLGNLSIQNSPIKIETQWNFDVSTIKDFYLTNSYRGGVSVFVTLNNNQVFLWGANDHGQLGIGNVNLINTPTLANWSFNGQEIKRFLTLKSKINNNGIDTIFVELNNEDIYAWGNNNHNQLGNNDNTTSFHTPVKVDQIWGFKGSDIKDFYFFNNSLFLIKNNNQLLGWGYNGHNNLGLGNTNPVRSPFPLNINISNDNTIANYWWTWILISIAIIGVLITIFALLENKKGKNK